jgi:serine/threonine protein kinase
MIEFYDVEKKISIETEIKLMQMIDHPHIVKYFGHFIHSIEIQCILIEFCEVCKDV